MADRDALPSTSSLAMLSTAHALVAAPLAAHVPLWVLAYALIAGVSGMATVVLRKPPPPAALRILSVLAALAGVYASFHTLTGRDAGASLLLILLGLKLLESRALRDLYVGVCLGYFLVATTFFYSQDILLCLYLVAPVLLLTATLICASDLGNRLGPAGALRSAARILLYALPLTVTQFLLFPRVPGPLWGLPADAFTGVTGLSEELAPGTVTRLSQSDAVAFRAEFSGEHPPSALLYWRGPVFWHTDGRRWTLATPPGPPPAVRSRQRPVPYAQMVEPNNRRWLFPLDLPAAAPPGVEMTSDFQLLAPQPIRQRARYALSAVIPDATAPPTPAQRSLALQIPAPANPKSLQLAARWRDAHGTPEAIVREALGYFRQQAFTYTLKPPALGADAVDQFLFETQRGYCEHFATAFTYLMRAAGVPSRVVTGYQGGTYNPLGGYVLVRQRDAHAWSEVWLPSSGWTRVDPTGAVAPQRIELGAEGFLDMAAGAAQTGLPTSAAWRRAAAHLRLIWDTVDSAWDRWILAYGPELQLDLFRDLGWTRVSWQGLTLVLALGLAGGLALIALFTAPLLQRSDALTALYERFCARLARKGLARFPHEGPLDYAQRVSLAAPEHARAVRLITRLYVALRYDRPWRQSGLRRLARLVGQFRP
jgi:transglutaminase-like putative cysteine protease